MDIQAELDGHYYNLISAGGIEPYVTKNQVITIAGLMNKVLTTRSQRIAVLKMIAGNAMQKVAGVEVSSTKNLTGRMASYLIDQFLVPKSKPQELSDYGREFLEGCKASLENRSSQ